MYRTFLVTAALAVLALPNVVADPEDEPQGTNRSCVASGEDPSPWVMLDTPECLRQAERMAKFACDMLGVPCELPEAGPNVRIP